MFVGIAILAGALFAVPLPASASGNVNFVGTWVPDNGVGWAITSEDSATGACVGTSALSSSGYGLIDCQVTGDKYVFTVTYGASYQSKNTGIITGNTLSGSYTDTNGTNAAYSATRLAPPATTAVGCVEQDSPRGTFRCTTKVSAPVSPSSVPTGSVTFSVSAGVFNPVECGLKKTAGSDSSAECSVVDTPTAAANAAPETVIATYSGDASLGPSMSQTTIAAVSLSGASKTVDTYLEGSDKATFTVKLSRIANTPVSFDYATEDGTGPTGAVAAKGEYQDTKGTATIAPGQTSKTVDVLCYANVEVRAPAQFDLVLSNASGAEFTADAVASAQSALPPAPANIFWTAEREEIDANPNTYVSNFRPRVDAPTSLTVPETIKPNLRVGEVGAIKDLTTGRAGRIFVRRFNSLRLTQLHEGDAIFVGDELLVDPNTASDVQFVLGGAAALQPGVIVRVQDERHTVLESGGETLLTQKINLIINVSHQKETIQIQTNGGVIGVKG
jgi:hypothetical protein